MPLVLAEFSPGKRGQVNAVAALLRLKKRCKEAVGSSFYIGSGQDFVRELSAQIVLLEQNYYKASSGQIFWAGSWWKKRTGTDPKTGRAYVAVATPGGGKHPKGIAADITFETPQAHAWFRSHSHEEYWNSYGDYFGESWHKEYYGPTDGNLAPASGTGTEIPKEDELATAEVKAIFDKLDSIAAAMSNVQQLVTDNFAALVPAAARGEDDEANIGALIQSRLIIAPGSAVVAATKPFEGFWFEFASWEQLEFYQKMNLIPKQIQQITDAEFAELKATAALNRK